MTGHGRGNRQTKGATMKRLILSIALLVTLPLAAQEVDSQASKAADTYLGAVRIAVLPEGKEVLARVTWDWSGQDAYPLYSDVQTLFEGMFPTDVPNVVGYKRLVELKALTESGSIVVKQYKLIAYKDKSLGVWKVLTFYEARLTTHELSDLKPKVVGDKCISAYEVGRNSQDGVPCQFVYTGYGVDCMLAGKLSQARESFDKAFEINRRSPDTNWSPDRDYFPNLRMIASISGTSVDK